jgi:acyl-CoA synthetase (AMP-forming)/AMP-acid ligase II
MAPISTLSAPQELAHILRHSDAQIFLSQRRYAGRDFGALIARALPSLDTAQGTTALRLRETPYLRSIWLDDAHDISWAGAISDLIEHGQADAAMDAAFMAEIRSETASSDDAVIIYTSGSTALPKAVIHTQGPMARQIQLLAEAHVAFEGERVLCLLPMFWVGGMTMMMEVFHCGGCIVTPESPSPRSIVDAIRDLKADTLHGWPPQRKPVRDIMQAEGIDYSGVRHLRDEYTADGALITFDMVMNSLGMTESFGPHGAVKLGTMAPPDRRGIFAAASGGFERRVVDPETGEILPEGATGELQIRGGSLMRGYYKIEPSEAFTPDGFFSTRDLVRIEPDGLMYFQGRLGDMLKTRGANVSRLEVEAALRKIPGVAEAVVCGLLDAEAGQIIVAAAVPAASTQLTEADLKTALRDLIAPYKIPAHILILGADELLWTPTGKIRITEMGALIAQRLGRSS